jgi:predicted RNA methylase
MPGTAFTMNNKTFNSLLFINECLLDEERTGALRTAIRRRVHAGDTVLDAGTGSGILALFAAEAGAKKVYAVDIDPEALWLAQQSTQASPYHDRIEIVEADIHQFTMASPVDVVIMEMLDTGLIAEQQAPALNSLRRHQAIGPRTKIVPQGVRCSLEAVEFDFDFYGFSMPLTIQARNHGAQKRVRKVLTDRAIYLEVDFGTHICTRVEKTLTMTARHPGVLNALRLGTETVLADDFSIWETTDMNMPIIIPTERIDVEAGDRIKMSIQYTMGRGFKSFEASVSR